MPRRRRSDSPDRAFEQTCHKRSGTESNKVRSRSSSLVGDMIERPGDRGVRSVQRLRCVLSMTPSWHSPPARKPLEQGQAAAAERPPATPTDPVKL
jgi:hypothetical protein